MRRSCASVNSALSRAHFVAKFRQKLQSAPAVAVMIAIGKSAQPALYWTWLRRIDNIVATQQQLGYFLPGVDFACQ
jgi:hypothetical protein